MPAVAKGKFFFSMSLQTFTILTIILFVAVASLSYVSSLQLFWTMKARN
jgi:hypothetical protein